MLTLYNTSTISVKTTNPRNRVSRWSKRETSLRRRYCFRSFPGSDAVALGGEPRAGNRDGLPVLGFLILIGVIWGPDETVRRLFYRLPELPPIRGAVRVVGRKPEGRRGSSPMPSGGTLMWVWSRSWASTPRPNHLLPLQRCEHATRDVVLRLPVPPHGSR